MIKLYSTRKSEQILRRYENWIDTVSRRYGIPAACIKAILFMELTEIDLLDLAADFAVQGYWWRYALGTRLQRAGLVRGEVPKLRRGVFGKKDSSTGHAQIFGYVGIQAINFALDRGLVTPETLGVPADHRLRSEDPEDLCAVWRLLHRNSRANLEIASLNLLSAAEEMTGRIDFAGYTPEELKLVLTRYNANVKHITAYGEKAYQQYLRFR